MCNILVVYYIKGVYPLRATVADHLYSFQEYTSDNCFYLNLAIRQVPSYISKIQFDLIIFHTVFFSLRWNRVKFERCMQKARLLKELNAVKVAIPQDEFINTDLVCNFINEFGIDYVFSAAPESEWAKIYATVDFQRVKIFTVLTGYLHDATIAKINALAKLEPSRSIDIGYRSGLPGFWLGRLGLLKEQIADCFQAKAPQKGLITDISTHPQDTFLGDDWYRFLLRCKYTLGVESGASILDHNGTLRQNTETYVAAHPQAGFEEVEAHCFPNLDGSLNLGVISPRHLEACVTRTCQILIEGTYSGILVSGQHYIALKRDFSNMDQVLDIIKQDQLRETITERAYNDIVGSGQYSYQEFVNFVLQKSLGSVKTKHLVPLNLACNRVFCDWMQLADRLSWVIVALLFIAHRLLKRILPERIVETLKSALKQ